ncbi:hypothetical protein R5R35_013469 [Gryllus longicercus]|uniref:MANSC domain-containing protein n=1 Tax=Gryllus longicercus TaxID=2509291 RepID=A0AAN9VM84_9ORTH
MKFFLGICICVFASVSADSGRGADDAAPKLLTNFRNFEACLDNFNIHNDKIIRTEDSRAMGAKYISESDMNSREECLRLCCVTDTCDVFVFEEKRPGSCYLFNCGSAADFKCKFTKHHNYTSGILTLEHDVALDPDLPSKHEQELNQLRRPEGASSTSLNFTFGATSQPQLHLQGIFHKPNKTTDQSSIKIRQCSRFQFKCRTSGECIAIYNACDGIPQCADGSDESSELGCRTPVTSSLVPIVASSGNKTDQEDALPKSYGNPYHLQQKMFLANKLKNEETNVKSEPVIENTHIHAESDHPVQIPQSTRNIMKQPETSHISAPEYQPPHQQIAFSKPDNPSERNPSSVYTGFRPYLNQRIEQESEKIVDEEHNYITEKLLSERNKETDHSGYNHKSEDLNLQSHIRTSFLQPQPNIPDISDHAEHMSLFQNAEHIPKTHSASQMVLKQQQADLANALRHQLANVHLSEVQPEMYQKEHVEGTKEAKFALGNQADGSHPTHLELPNENIDKISPQQVHIDVDNEHRLRNMKEQMQVPYQEPQLPEVPDRSYKYEDEERHIFNHKGYGLVAESDSSEIPYKIAVPNVQFKLNNAQSNGYMNNMPEYGNKLQRNMWAESIRPTSHELKTLKNTPQPIETNNGYPLPSDYMYNEGQHSLLNAVSLIPHRSNADHLPTLHAASGHVGSLERTNILRENQEHRDHSHESVSKMMNLNNQKPSASKQDVFPVHDNNNNNNNNNIAYEKEQPIITHTVAPAPVRATASTTAKSDTAEVPKEKHEGKHHEHFVGLQQAYISELPNDQQQDRPSGALLSMSFGLCITFVMVVLVACRLRVVKRRLRRNGKSLYAHDADYLVNGMYL